MGMGQGAWNGVGLQPPDLIGRCPTPAHVAVRRLVRPRREPHRGWPRMGARGPVIPALGRGVVPTVFWGTGGARGWASRGMAETPAALILMSDWCGPADAADATTIENRGA